MLAGLLLVLATIVGYLRLAIVDSDQFANRATATLKDPSVRNLVAERVTDQVVLAQPLRAARGAAAHHRRDVGDRRRRRVRDAVPPRRADVHRAVFDHDQDTISLTLVDVGTVAGEALQSFRPKLAAQVEGASRISLLGASASAAPRRGHRTHRRQGAGSWRRCSRC